MSSGHSTRRPAVRQVATRRHPLRGWGPSSRLAVSTATATCCRAQKVGFALDVVVVSISISLPRRRPFSTAPTRPPAHANRAAELRNMTLSSPSTARRALSVGATSDFAASSLEPDQLSRRAREQQSVLLWWCSCKLGNKKWARGESHFFHDSSLAKRSNRCPPRSTRTGGSLPSLGSSSLNPALAGRLVEGDETKASATTCNWASVN